MSDQLETIPHTTVHAAGTHLRLADGSLVTIAPERVEELYEAMRTASQEEPRRALTADQILAFATKPANEAVSTPVQTPVEASADEPPKTARTRAKEA